MNFLPSAICSTASTGSGASISLLVGLLSETIVYVLLAATVPSWNTTRRRLCKRSPNLCAPAARDGTARDDRLVGVRERSRCSVLTICWHQSCASCRYVMSSLKARLLLCCAVLLRELPEESCCLNFATDGATKPSGAALEQAPRFSMNAALHYS